MNVLIDQILLSSERKKAWKEIQDVLLSDYSQKLDSSRERSVQAPDFSGLVPLTQMHHIYSYEGSYHSYLLAQVFANKLF